MRSSRRGIAPEDVKGLIEKLPVGKSIDEHRMQRPVEVIPVGDAHGAHRVHRIQHPAGTDGQSCGPQHPGKVHDVRQKAPTAGPGVVGFSHGAPPGGWQTDATPSSSAHGARRKRALDLVEQARRLAAAHLGDVVLILQ